LFGPAPKFNTVVPKTGSCFAEPTPSGNNLASFRFDTQPGQENMSFLTQRPCEVRGGITDGDNFIASFDQGSEAIEIIGRIEPRAL
jgi:hypothetical protein